MKSYHIGLIIAVLLIVYWYMKDHPQTAPAPVKEGSVVSLMLAA